MIKKIVVALVLTFPIYAFVGGSGLVTYWFTYGNGWDVFAPLLNVMRGIGFEGQAAAMYTAMLIISFILSLIVVFTLSAWLRRRHKKSV
ncbi:Uncharacterised protein [Serratia ficaria]|uniref:hypothetical protein n=1 Tax=Serratia ficaria TaxID=61651 RepID=UPI002183B795|nr:hypothetical protein [Serratia ficaria]CAI2468787.1 Uncharacterised protein [Serratia ficaria]CAI2487565.1 Uncharacterised protein [Serratia ficaria]